VVGCVVAGPVDDPEASTGSTTGADSAATNESESATQGQSSTTSAVTGATATTTSATGPGTSTTTGADPSVTGTATASSSMTDGDPSEDDATSASDTGGPRAQCGIEIDPAGGLYEAGCGCDTCDLYWDDLDEASFELIIESCDCLCEAAGCGENSGEAVAGAEADSGGRGEASSG